MVTGRLMQQGPISRGMNEVVESTRALCVALVRIGRAKASQRVGVGVGVPEPEKGELPSTVAFEKVQFEALQVRKR